MFGVIDVDTHFSCTTFVNAYDAVIFAGVTSVDVHTGWLTVDTKCCFYLVKSDKGGGGPLINIGPDADRPLECR